MYIGTDEMIIKETPWETRNLGVQTSVEFYFEVTDVTISETVLKNTIYRYQVAHVPVGRVDLVNELLDNGFSFSETKIELSADLKALSLPNRFARFSEKLSYHAADEQEITRIFKSMKEGVFATDKVALDPYYDACKAGERYVYWTQDEINSGSTWAYIVTNDGLDLGFFVLKRVTDRIGDSFLAGLFDKERDSGLGFSVLYFPMLEAKNNGIKKMVTGVSSNNPDSLKMHLALGYEIKNMVYTLIKHT